MGHADEQHAGTTGARGTFVCGTLAHDATATEHDAPAAEMRSCPACGARARRAAARYCATCGRHLRERDYSPADALRASYRWPNITRPAARPAPPWRRRNEQTARGYVFLVYAFVPLVGVVFCACAFACCAAGACDARRSRRAAEAVEARRGLAYAVLLAGAQVLLWLFMFTLPVWL